MLGKMKYYYKEVYIMLEKKDYITVNNSIQRFVHKKTGDIFVPIGVNYFPRGTGWAPKIWDRSQVAEYERDFPRIKALGMNIIRVFLSFKKLMPQPNQMDQNVLTYIKELLECAEKYDIRVIFSGSPVPGTELPNGLSH